MGNLFEIKGGKGEFVAGIDPSKTATGLVILSMDSGEVIEKMTIKPKGKGIRRCAYIRDQIVEKLDEYAVTHAGIESYAFGGQGAHHAGEIGGIIRLGVIEYGCKLIEISPGTIKKFVTGRGNAPKEQMILHAFKRWGVTCSTSDEADALGIAHMVRATLIDVDLTKAQKESIEKMKMVA